MGTRKCVPWELIFLWKVFLFVCFLSLCIDWGKFFSELFGELRFLSCFGFPLKKAWLPGDLGGCLNLMNPLEVFTRRYCLPVLSSRLPWDQWQPAYSIIFHLARSFCYLQTLAKWRHSSPLFQLLLITLLITISSFDHLFLQASRTLRTLVPMERLSTVLLLLRFQVTCNWAPKSKWCPVVPGDVFRHPVYSFKRIFIWKSVRQKHREVSHLLAHPLSPSHAYSSQGYIRPKLGEWYLIPISHMGGGNLSP